MDTPYCDVVGCSAKANWVLRNREDRRSEEYLCGPHYNELRRRSPDLSTSYMPLSISCTVVVTPEKPVAPSPALVHNGNDAKG